jgi:hypothetical protein
MSDDTPRLLFIDDRNIHDPGLLRHVDFESGSQTIKGCARVAEREVKQLFWEESMDESNPQSAFLDSVFLSISEKYDREKTGKANALGNFIKRLSAATGVEESALQDQAKNKRREARRLAAFTLKELLVRPSNSVERFDLRRSRGGTQALVRVASEGTARGGRRRGDRVPGAGHHLQECF